MPNDFMTFRLEYGFRKSNVPYFAGPGGTASQTGFSNNAIDPTWKPDLRKQDHSGSQFQIITGRMKYSE
ncbi:hypothetical protein [Pedobacter sp. NJ-S-72]